MAAPHIFLPQIQKRSIIHISDGDDPKVHHLVKEQLVGNFLNQDRGVVLDRLAELNPTGAVTESGVHRELDLEERDQDQEK